MRRIPLTLAISLGLHVLPVWACWNAIQGMAPGAPLVLVRVVDVGEAAVDGASGAGDALDGGMAGLGSDGGAPGKSEPSEDELRRGNLRRVREQASSALAKRRAEARIALRALAERTRELEEREQSAHAAAELAATRRDALQTSAGHLRVARAPAEQASERARLALADVVRAEAEAEAAQARAKLAEEAAQAAVAPPAATAQAARRAHRGTPSTPEARAKEGDATPASSKANAERARANAAMQQAEQALAHADEVRAAEARALAAVAPVEAAVQADKDAAAKAADAQEQADHEVIAAQQALVASTAQLAAAERQVERAAARAQLDPDDWVHLPAPSGTPGGAADPAARPDAPDGRPVEPGRADVAAAQPLRTRPPEPPTEAHPSALTTAVASALAALTFVRTDGDAAAAWDPTAHLIGTSSLHAAVMSRSLTNVTPIKTPAARPAVQGAPDQAPSAQSGAEVAHLAPLRSDGPAPDGFVLALLDDTPRAPPRTASARAEPAEAEAAATDPEAVEPDELPLTDVPDPMATVSVVPEDIPEGAVTRLSVSGHPLAAWMNGVDEALRRGWDYPLEARALGVHGTVEVRFIVLPSGRVTDVTVTMADAPPELVNAATGSIPARVKPPGEELEIRYTFRYRLAGGA